MSLEELIRNALILAKKEDFDVYNCLDLMDNESIFKVEIDPLRNFILW